VSSGVTILVHLSDVRLPVNDIVLDDPRGSEGERVCAGRCFAFSLTMASAPSAI